MKRKITLGLALLAASMSASITAAESYAIVGSTGGNIGNVVIESGPHGSVIRIVISEGGLTPGWHGIHLHAVADCSDIGVFKNSKGHVNPASTEHGFLNPAGAHPADLPNIFAHADGSSTAEILAPGVSLGGDGANLTDDDGSAIVIHESPDDHNTQPIGGAGARVACAAIK